MQYNTDNRLPVGVGPQAEGRSMLFGEREPIKSQNRGLSSNTSRSLTSWEVKAETRLDERDLSARNIDAWSHLSEPRRNQLLRNREKKQAAKAKAAAKKAALPSELSQQALQSQPISTASTLANPGQVSHEHGVFHYAGPSASRQGYNTGFQNTQSDYAALRRAGDESGPTMRERFESQYGPANPGQGGPQIPTSQHRGPSRAPSPAQHGLPGSGDQRRRRRWVSPSGSEEFRGEDHRSK